MGDVFRWRIGDVIYSSLTDDDQSIWELHLKEGGDPDDEMIFEEQISYEEFINRPGIYPFGDQSLC